MKHAPVKVFGMFCAMICGPLAFAPIAFSQWSPTHIQVDGVGWEGQGADLVLTNLDNNPRPEMILMAYDNPAQDNTFRYKIGWNLGTNGVAASWSNFITAPGVGWEGQGAAMDLINLNDDDNPEMIIMAYDNPSQGNTFRYRVGRDLNNTGVAASWSNSITTAGVGWEGQGAGMAMTNLDNNRSPEMVLMAYDNPSGANTFRYRIGWNINNNAVAASWSNAIEIPGVGWEGQGADVTITNLDNNQRPEMILMAYDNPSGANNFRYKIGWNLDANGVAAVWDAGFTTVTGVGWEGQGAGFAVFNLDTDPRPEFIVMAYDNPSQANNFRYRIGWNLGRSRSIHLEEDRLINLAWPPNAVNRGSRINSLRIIYNAAGYDLNEVRDQAAIADIRNGQPYSIADMHAFLNANMNRPPANPNVWHMYCAVLTRDVDGDLGIMFRTADRRGFAIFASEFTNNDAGYLRSTAHELGHALNLFHSDGDANVNGVPQNGQGRTIMNQTRRLANNWDYVWSAAELDHLYEQPEEFIRPNSGFGFGTCITTHLGLY